MDTMNLTDEQIDFLAQCEADFANRYTDKDDNYSNVMAIGISRPPIVEPWRPKGTVPNNRDNRDNRDSRDRLKRKNPYQSHQSRHPRYNNY